MQRTGRGTSVCVTTKDEIFVHGGLFKKIVPKMCNNSCFITGMHGNRPYGHTFIDACHIVPFNITHNDTIKNGIAFRPNLHGAFDRGLLTIDTDYRVKVSAAVMGNAGHPNT